MSRRPPAPPPDLPGHTVIKLLGSGGFADVYLYEQQLPRRSVAVKVLIPGIADDEQLARFDAEANLMAALSTHPAIVTIHQAGISADERPYLVMEYCSRPNLSARYRSERLAVAEVLRIGVRLSGAVETAHRAGILHRDIKPANVLTTDFGHPVLSDFGISVQSAHRTAVPAGTAVGMSIPWTAPEVFAEQVGGDERADIYSLAATLYTLLARRSPFDRPGGPNTSADLINRIRAASVPALGRSDVPAGLERVLGRAMDKNPAARYTTALDLARALQQVESELRLSATPVDVLDEDPDGAVEQLGDSPATRVRALTVISPEPGPGPAPAVPGGVRPPPPEVMPEYDVPPAPRPSTGVAPVEGHTRARRPPVQVGPTAPGPNGRPQRRAPLLIGGGLLVVAAVVVAVVLATRGTEPPPAPAADPADRIPSRSQQVLPDPPGEVTELTGTVVAGQAVFNWTDPDRQADDFYYWERTDPGAGTGDTGKTPDTSVTFQRQPQQACILVKVVRPNGDASQGTRACVGDP